MFWTGYLYRIGSTGVLLNSKGKRRFIWVVSYLFVWLLLVFVVWMWVTVLVSPSDWPWWSPPSRAASRWGSPPCRPDSCSAPGSPSPSSEPDAAPPAGPGAPVRSRTSTRRPSSAVCGAPGVSPSARTSPHRAGSQSPAGDSRHFIPNMTSFWTKVLLPRSSTLPECTGPWSRWFWAGPGPDPGAPGPGTSGQPGLPGRGGLWAGGGPSAPPERRWELFGSERAESSAAPEANRRRRKQQHESSGVSDDVSSDVSDDVSDDVSVCCFCSCSYFGDDVKTLFNLRMNLQRLSFQPVL